MASFENGHALLIGVGGDLPNTVEDARGLQTYLTDPARCAYPQDQVSLLTAEEATRDGVLGALDELAARTNVESTLIVYFSGHGYRFQSDFGATHFLLPFNYDIDALATTAISGLEFTGKLQAIPAQKMLLLLDCCHAGGLDDLANTKAPGLEMAKAPLPPEATALFGAGRGRVVIASSRADELSYAGRPYSAFTLALLEGLCGEGASKLDGYVRVADLALWTGGQVPRRTKDRQNPILNYAGADNFVVAYYAGGDEEPKGAPVSPEQVEIEAEPGAMRAAFDQRGQSVGGHQLNVEGASNVDSIVGGDQTIHDESVGGDNIVIGDISGQGIAIGRGASAQVRYGLGGDELASLFEPLYQQIQQRPPDPDVDRDEITELARKIEDEVGRGDDANEKKVLRWLDTLADIAPDIFETAALALVNPTAGIASAIRTGVKVLRARR